MHSREDLLRDLDAAYQEFHATLEGLDEHEFDTKWLDGRWGVREITAHISGWLGQMGGGLERMARGERPTPEGVDFTDVQKWNDTFANHAKGKRHAQVLDELEHALQAFTQAARNLPEDRFGEGKTANRMFEAVGAPHLLLHAEMVREWRQRAGI